MLLDRYGCIECSYKELVGEGEKQLDTVDLLPL